MQRHGSDYASALYSKSEKALEAELTGKGGQYERDGNSPSIPFSMACKLNEEDAETYGGESGIRTHGTR